MKKFPIYFVLIVLALNGCAKKEEASVSSLPTQESVSSTGKTAPDLSSAGTLKGVVSFEGVVPETKDLMVRGNPECAVFHPGRKIKNEELVVNGGKLQNCFVYVKEGLEKYSFETPSAPVTIENKLCVYAPHVTGAQVGQEIVFLNEDATLHNIHSYSKNTKSFNLGLPFQGMKQTKKFNAPEVMVALKCDVHPWMQGYLGVLPHPYFAVTKDDGSFEIKNIPAGEYLVEVWHEKLGVQSQKIKIEPQGTQQIDFTFKA